MATQAVETASQQTEPDNGLESALSLHARQRAKYHEFLAFLALPAFTAALGFLFPPIRQVVWNVLGTFVIFLAVEAVKYLREFHPSFLPPVLDEDAPLRIKLSRAKTVLNRTFWTAMGSGVVFVLLGACRRDDPPILLIAVVLVVALTGSGLGSLAIAVYLGLRTKPQLKTRTANNWPRVPRPISEIKPFHSDHWGQPRNSSPTAL